MQGAFSDALVTPVFKLLAELLPLVDNHCIRQLNINRSFWNSMQNQSIITTENIILYLKGVTDEVSSNEGDREPLSTGRGEGDPIPGIPANAFKAHDEHIVRKLSLVPNQNQNIDLNDLELGQISPMLDDVTKTKGSYATYCTVCLQGTKVKVGKMLESGPTQIILFVATIFALLANDLNLIIGNKGTDMGVDIVVFLVFLVFLVEMVVSILYVQKYTHFFLWLDLAAIISLLLELDFLLELGSGSSPGDFALAKASRAAKVGARAGR